MEINLPHLKDAIKITVGVTGKDGVFHEIMPSPVLPPQWERCIFCETLFDLNNLHPGHVKYFGNHPHVCRECGFVFGPYGKIWSSDIESRITYAKNHAGLARECFFCKKEFNLLKGFFYRRSNDMQQDGIDFLYPNLYTSICTECFNHLFSYNIECSPCDQLQAVRELGERIGKLPVKNFPPYIYLCQDRESIEWFLNLLRRLPSTSLIDARFGSYFKLLVNSGLLPEGTRRMRLGTWTLAKDGDMCFSLVERDIDDWLFRRNIAHTKEVKYPGSEMRCDWEVYKDGQRIFIEYFGLMNQSTYASKAALKRQLAAENGIILIGLMPTDDWEEVLSTSLL